MSERSLRWQRRFLGPDLTGYVVPFHVADDATQGRFVGPVGHAEVAVVVVTYNSADDIDALIRDLRSVAAEREVRLVVVDNESADGTVALVRQHNDVVVVESGGNKGYAAGLNAGMRAAGENQVRHPLQECNLSKNDVRKLAKAWDLPTWDKPATPCLSSRIAYGENVTPERVRMIDLAEQWLRARGLRTLRVRYHKGDMARVEVPLADLPGLIEPEVRSALTKHFRDLGFKYVTLDLEGFRSGSMNAVIPLESLQRPAAMRV